MSAWEDEISQIIVRLEVKKVRYIWRKKNSEKSNEEKFFFYDVPRRNEIWNADLTQ